MEKGTKIFTKVFHEVSWWLLFFGLIFSCIRLQKANTQIETLIVEVRYANKAEEQAQKELELYKGLYRALEESYEQQEQSYIEQHLAEPETIDLPTKTLTVKVSAYCPCPICCGIWSKDHPCRQGTDYEQTTALGAVPTAGHTISVDPEVIPLGSKVRIDGHEYTAEDTGGAIKGNRIDMFFATHQEALDWGLQTKEIKVYEN